MGNDYLAIDIGASSGRHILGRLEGGRLVLEEVHRFENGQLRRDGHNCWDLDRLWRGILEGLRLCGASRRIPAAIGIDTWGVDYVLLDEKDRLLGGAVSYRDERTQGIPALVEKAISPEELYTKTGIQRQDFNTIYQLAAQLREEPGKLESARSLLMIPDYFGFLLTGEKRQEYTNATTTGLVNAAEKAWDRELICRLGLPERLFGPLSMPGTVVGRLRPGIQEEVGFDARVVLPATHDTGSAFLAVPARDENAVFLSSGTWSLLGVENRGPLTGEAGRRANFTNEGGAWGRFRYLKNIMGLWMIQSIRRELNGTAYVAGKAVRPSGDRIWSFQELSKEAEAAADFPSAVDVNDPRFLAPESMSDAVRAFCRERGQPVPRTVGELMQCVYRSLSLCYRDAVRELSGLTGRRYTAIHIVGGGCQDSYLNRLTAQAAGLPVTAGPVEGTAIGNLLVQLAAAGELSGLEAGRALVRSSFEIKEVTP